jgi:LacI family transcriptional regulator
MSISNPPIAVLVCNDEMAQGAIYAVNKMGTRVPKEVSIVWFDNTLLLNFICPPLYKWLNPSKIWWI